MKWPFNGFHDLVESDDPLRKTFTDKEEMNITVKFISQCEKVLEYIMMICFCHISHPSELVGVVFCFLFLFFKLRWVFPNAA